MTLYEKLYEREGNDAWLKDCIEIRRTSIGLIMEHKVRHTGWNGDCNEDYTINLDSDDIEASQKKIDNYLEDNMLKEDFSIDLKSILNKD